MVKVYKQSSSRDLNPEDFDIAKQIRCPGALISGINTCALMLRIELFVDEWRWKSLHEEKAS
jgi:hypothetical protein